MRRASIARRKRLSSVDATAGASTEAAATPQLRAGMNLPPSSSPTGGEDEVTPQVHQMFGAQARRGSQPTTQTREIIDALEEERPVSSRRSQRRTSRSFSKGSVTSMFASDAEQGEQHAPNSLTQHCAKALHQLSKVPRHRDGMVGEVRRRVGV